LDSTAVISPMLNVYGLQTELSEAKALLALAEDVIIGLRSGIESPSVRKEGTFGREKDKAGLRELLHGKDEVCKLGSITWHEVSLHRELLLALRKGIMTTVPSRPQSRR
jgi:hypothetical protein